jgi:hypothetical protein
VNTGAVGDPYVIIRDGGIDNQPALPVLDLRFMDGYPFDAAAQRTAKETLHLARTLNLNHIVEEIQTFLNRHQPSGRRRK